MGVLDHMAVDEKCVEACTDLDSANKLDSSIKKVYSLDSYTSNLTVIELFTFTWIDKF